MFSRSFLSIVLATLFFLFFDAHKSYCQDWDYEVPVKFARRNMGGPRIGMTIVPGSNDMTKKLEENGLGNTLSQFGWHFEWQVVPRGGGPSFVIELVPLLAGVEYGKVIPSATLALGIRTQSGFEFGMGPNVLVGRESISSALVIAIGKSFNYSGVSIPVNLAFATNPQGNRISVVFGYAMGD